MTVSVIIMWFLITDKMETCCKFDGDTTHDVEVPGRPEDVTATGVINGSTTLTWNAPKYDGGSSVTGYYVEMYNGSGWIMINEIPITACRVDIDDLVKGIKNEMRVRAENAVGLGPPSVSTVIVVEHKCDVPGRPDTPVITRVDVPGTRSSRHTGGHSGTCTRYQAVQTHR